MKKIAPFPEYVELQENKGDIYRDFSETILTFRDAIVHLQKIGHDQNEAERIVNEWAELLEALLRAQDGEFVSDPGARTREPAAARQQTGDG